MNHTDLHNQIKEFGVVKLYLEFKFLLDSNVCTLLFTDQIYFVVWDHTFMTATRNGGLEEGLESFHVFADSIILRQLSILNNCPFLQMNG